MTIAFSLRDNFSGGKLKAKRQVFELPQLSEARRAGTAKQCWPNLAEIRIETTLNILEKLRAGDIFFGVELGFFTNRPKTNLI